LLCDAPSPYFRLQCIFGSCILCFQDVSLCMFSGRYFVGQRHATFPVGEFQPESDNRRWPGRPLPPSNSGTEVTVMSVSSYGEQLFSLQLTLDLFSFSPSATSTVILISIFCAESLSLPNPSIDQSITKTETCSNMGSSGRIPVSAPTFNGRVTCGCAVVDEVGVIYSPVLCGNPPHSCQLQV
jgi:hypothetical protein